VAAAEVGWTRLWNGEAARAADGEDKVGATDRTADRSALRTAKATTSHNVVRKN
jgi:hypothetical protein